MLPCTQGKNFVHLEICLVDLQDWILLRSPRNKCDQFTEISSSLIAKLQCYGRRQNTAAFSRVRCFLSFLWIKKNRPQTAKQFWVLFDPHLAVSNWFSEQNLQKFNSKKLQHDMTTYSYSLCCAISMCIYTQMLILTVNKNCSFSPAFFPFPNSFFFYSSRVFVFFLSFTLGLNLNFIVYPLKFL